MSVKRRDDSGLAWRDNRKLIVSKWKTLGRVWLSVTSWTIQSTEFSRPEYYSGYRIPSPGNLPNPGNKPRSPTLQVDSLPAESPGSPSMLKCVAYPFSRGPSWPRNWTRLSSIAGEFFTSWAPREGLLLSKLTHILETEMT